MKLSACIAIFLVLCGAAFGQPPGLSPLERAITLTREKRYAEAQQLLQSVSAPGPANQRIAFHRLKAAIASGLNDAPAAAHEMQQALELAPVDPALLLATALAELQASQLDAALRHVQAVEANPIARAIAGDIQEKRGAFPEAIAAYREAVRLDPAKEEYRTTLAFDLIRHQAFKAAIEALHEALPIFPKSVRLRTLLGIAQYAAGDTEDATASLSEAITLDPHAEPAYRSLTRILLQSSTAPSPAIVEQLCGWNAVACGAMKLREARETDNTTLLAQATQALEQAAATDTIAHCELARAREWANKVPEARIEMEKCVIFDPSPQNHFRLGLIYQRLGLPALAQTEMDLRNRILTTMSEQTANGLSALATLQ